MSRRALRFLSRSDVRLQPVLLGVALAIYSASLRALVAFRSAGLLKRFTVDDAFYYHTLAEHFL